MPIVGQVGLYSSIIVMGAIAGAVAPIRTQKASSLTGLLAFAAGVMLGAAFFHMLPEAFHSGGYAAFSFVPLGFFFLFLLERYALVHICEEPPDCVEHLHKPGAGLMAFFGLSIHTLFDGVALASASMEGVGLMAFVAIASHKVPSSLSLASILKAEGRSSSRIMGAALLFGLMVPVGAVLYLALESALRFQSFSPKALAFSAGTFLYIAVSDLLPRVNRHGADGRLRNLIALAAGLSLMFALTWVTEHKHG